MAPVNKFMEAPNAPAKSFMETPDPIFGPHFHQLFATITYDLVLPKTNKSRNLQFSIGKKDFAITQPLKFCTIR